MSSLYRNTRTVSEQKKVWTILDVLDWTTQYLKEKAFENPRLNTEWLLCHALQFKRLDLYLNFDRPLSLTELRQFKSLLKRRLDHEPLQYITGITEFMGLPFQVNRAVLIPRPDTEILTEKAIEISADYAQHHSAPAILDIGTGSGAIAIAVAHFLQKKNIPAQIHGVDVSPEAVETAKINARQSQVDSLVSFHAVDLLTEVFIERFRDTFDIIVSNPPYISDKEFLLLPEEVKTYEPASALLAQDDGTFFYGYIAKISSALFRPDSVPKYLLFEVGFDQSDHVKNILFKSGFKNIEIIKDYNHIPRVVLGIGNV